MKKMVYSALCTMLVAAQLCNGMETVITRTFNDKEGDLVIGDSIETGPRWELKIIAEQLDPQIARDLKYGYMKCIPFDDTGVNAAWREPAYEGLSFELKDVVRSGFVNNESFITLAKSVSAEVNSRGDLDLYQPLENKPNYLSVSDVCEYSGTCLVERINSMSEQRMMDRFEHPGCYGIFKYQNRMKSDLFVFFDPVKGTVTCTPPTYSAGLLCAIMTKFPSKGTKKDWKELVFDLEMNKRVCLFQAKDGGFELLRDLGNFPYCNGAYVNPKKNSVAILYGNNTKGLPRSLLFVEIGQPTIMSCKGYAGARQHFTDVVFK